MWRNLTGTSKMWVIIGIALILYTIYMLISSRTRAMFVAPYLVGMLSCGLGCLAMGLTSGFTDISPRGKIMTKFGILLFIIGIPLLAYSFYR